MPALHLLIRFGDRFHGWLPTVRKSEPMESVYIQVSIYWQLLGLVVTLYDPNPRTWGIVGPDGKRERLL